MRNTKEQFINAPNRKKGLSPSTIRRYEREYEKYFANTKLAVTTLDKISSIVLENSFLQIIREMALLRQATLRHEQEYPRYMPNYCIELAMMTGMRIGEITALKWSCIDDDFLHVDFSEHRLDYSDRPSELVIGEPKTASTG